MKSVIRTAVAFSLLVVMGTVSAQEPEPPYEPQKEIPPPIQRLKKGEQVLWRPCLGAGYVPYAYPAFGSCPCDTDRCFLPAQYYCGGKPYRRQWFGKWVRAHLGNGSMLEDFPCECIYPTSGRLHLLASDPAAEEVHEAPPIPLPAQP